MDTADLKHPLRQCSGLVEHHRSDLRQSLQVIRAFDQDPLVACAADPREEAQGDADHQRAGAADDKEGQCAVQPDVPLRGQLQNQSPHQRRENRKGQCAVHHRRGIDPGKAGDELLRAGLPRACIFHQLQNLRHGGFAEFLRGSDLQQTAQIDAAADDLIPLPALPRSALSGQRAGVQR